MFNQGQMERIANKLGYQGPMHKFNEFLASNPGAQRSFAGLEQKAKMMKMNAGGYVKKLQEGGIVQTSEGVGAPTVGQAVPQQIPYGPMLDESGQPQQEQVLDTEGNPVLDPEGNVTMRDVMPTISDVSAQRMYQPGLPVGGQQLAQGVEFQTPQAIAESTGGTQNGYTAAALGEGTLFAGDVPAMGRGVPTTTAFDLFYKTASNGQTTGLAPADLATSSNQNLLRFTIVYVAT